MSIQVVIQGTNMLLATQIVPLPIGVSTPLLVYAAFARRSLREYYLIPPNWTSDAALVCHPDPCRIVPQSPTNLPSSLSNWTRLSSSVGSPAGLVSGNVRTELGVPVPSLRRTQSRRADENFLSISRWHQRNVKQVYYFSRIM